MKKIVFCLIFIFTLAFGCRSLFAMEYMSSEDAAYFLGFLYNDSSLDAENLADNEFFKLIIGEYADDPDTETDIKAAFVAFEEAQVNNNITDSAYRSNKINDILLKLAYKELDGMSEIDSEIVSEVNDKYLDTLEEFIIDGLCSGVAASTGVIVTEDVVENLKSAYSGYTTLTSLGDKIEKFVDYTEASVALAFSPLQSELNGRYSYFNLYIINRASYSGEVLETVMAYNLMALKENNWSTMLINCIPGKTSWVNCTDQIEEWAEYVYQLDVQLQSAANEITVPTTEAGETDDEVTEEATETTTAASSGEKISGVYGDGVYWVYDTGTKIVFVTGTGELTSYTPWSSYSVSGLWIGGDITYNGDYTVTSSLPLTVYGNFTVTGSVTVKSGSVTLYGNMTVGGNYTHSTNNNTKVT
ncbi:MAG: hypothetical protein LIO87_10290, partial [Eubacterium sp.]|nr:hypothetical protein [Eubacterium sp.]